MPTTLLPLLSLAARPGLLALSPLNGAPARCPHPLLSAGGGMASRGWMRRGVPLSSPNMLPVRRANPAYVMGTVDTDPGLDTPPALTGGNIWSGHLLSKDEMISLCNEATSHSISAPIMKQFHPQRGWLWRQWTGTIVKAVLPREVALNCAIALCVTIILGAPGPHLSWRHALAGRLWTCEKVWALSSGLVSFTLSFFLNQSYALWRNVYKLTRRVQGRLNDLCLLVATTLARDPETHEYTDDSEALMRTVARYVRVFNLLLYASVSRRMAPLATPKGLSALVEANELTEEERMLLLEHGSGILGRGLMGHTAVLGWISVLLHEALADGRMAANAATAQPLQRSIEDKLLELRACYAGLSDELSGRMPLAYTQLVQILCDLLVLFSPFALMHAVGGPAAIVGTGCMTLFYSSVLKLAKMFLDPFDNEDYGGRHAIGINVATLIQETNLGSERWQRSARLLPSLPRVGGGVRRPGVREEKKAAQMQKASPMPSLHQADAKEKRVKPQLEQLQGVNLGELGAGLAATGGGEKEPLPGALPFSP